MNLSCSIELFSSTVRAFSSQNRHPIHPPPPYIPPPGPPPRRPDPWAGGEEGARAHAQLDAYRHRAHAVLRAGELPGREGAPSSILQRSTVQCSGMDVAESVRSLSHTSSSALRSQETRNVMPFPPAPNLSLSLSAHRPPRACASPSSSGPSCAASSSSPSVRRTTPRGSSCRGRPPPPPPP